MPVAKLELEVVFNLRLELMYNILQRHRKTYMESGYDVNYKVSIVA